MSGRRNFFKTGGAALLGAGLVGRAGATLLPEATSRTAPDTQVPPSPPDGQPYRPVTTLNGWSLPWRLKAGVKEFHLVAEPVLRELAPGMTARLWGYNGSSPGPTIEAVEGERVRIFVTNRLAEPTSVHWHGVRVPNGMDGVSGLTQPAIPPGKTYVYEFALQRPGTHMYHPHADEMVQMAMGMMGLFIIHPRDPRRLRVDRDYAFLMASYAIDPGASVPRPAEMSDFNLWTWNSRVFPGIAPLVARTGERVRIRVGNLTMTNHPIHMHGPHFEVTGTDGGWVPKTARWPEVTTDIAVGQMRAIEFDALAGDWAIHCHKAHHTMGPMSHTAANLVGVDQRGVADRIAKLVPGYMAMGSEGMAAMSDMPMPLPENTLPMMGGDGPFGSLEMGGMFSVVKVRDDLAPGDYRDPGWFKHPAGSVAREYLADALGEAPREPVAATPASSPLAVRKPSGSMDH